ncbi:sterile alpha motif domain-containing protein 3 [Pleuronectes platessa]|uniref:sterile alpha motif domain-containing protein 3 n=1 Tax=Pleuronectes platessa TaxID=8262 RepID=UPI00232A3179|nr:sterile alpha motif domain-containing protein 3 [Pleuronectes platessa]
MAVQQKFTMRVIVSEGDIRKLTMTKRPDTLEDLTGMLRDTLQANYTFVLQYQDPEFDNELCNLTDLSELPEKPTIKIIPLIELVPVTPQTESCSDTGSQADTDILSNSSLDRSFQWPEIFEIPKFSVDVEYRLRQGNLLYLRDATYLKMTKELKHDILEKLAETMYAFKAYPTKREFEDVAKALVLTHPCLKESGSSSCYDGWKNCLKFKMGNYRTKMRQLGRLDVTVNGGKRGRYSTDRDPPNKGIKKPRKGEINFLPEYPEGKDDHILEEARQVLVTEMMKTKQNASLVMKEMDVTFALRRKEVVKNKPPIDQMLQRWPALFTESQVFCEFNRVVGKGLRENFFDALDRFSPSLMDLFRKKRGLTGQILTDLLHKTKVNEPTHIRCLILRGLPIILGDDPSAFFRNCSDVNENGLYSQTAVGILCMDEENSTQLNPSKVGIILEGSVVMEDLANLPQAFCLLFGLIYALHLDYPKYMKNTFIFVQQVMLDLGRSELTPKIQTLKNQLAL